MSHVNVYGIDDPDWFAKNVLSPMILSGHSAKNEIYVIDNLYDSDPEDVAFEMKVHGFDARAVLD